jgi:UDP-N-acetylglucosamine acyltransferase
MSVHRTAIVSPKVKLAKGVKVGPYAIIEEDVEIGADTEIKAHAFVGRYTKIGKHCLIFPYASIGTIPQDLKFQGEKSQVCIGDDNTIREFVTINRGTKPGRSATILGDHNLIMAYAHIAHDCSIGNHVVLANAATLAGHIDIEDYAIIGGLVAIQQFLRIGTHAFIGGVSGVVQDIPPYVLASGNHAKLYGLNVVGLKRRNFSQETINQLKQAYKIILRSGLILKDAIEKAKKEVAPLPEVQKFIHFIEQSKRGITR